MDTDPDLLRRYADDRDEAAFAALVQRHLGLVHATALRLVGGDAHLAQDVASAAFTELARSAAALRDRATLAGWLHHTARFLALNALRAERRRREREQEAHAMNETDTTPDAAWQRFAPVLDDAVAALDEADRDALLLRYFQDKSHREVGEQLGLGEDAARMRVARALEKLREHFSKRGVTTTAALLSLTLGVHGSTPAPAGLSASITAKSLAAATDAASGAKFFLTAIWLVVAAAVVAVALIFLRPTKPVGPVATTPSFAPIPAAAPISPTDAALPPAPMPSPSASPPTAPTQPMNSATTALALAALLPATAVAADFEPAANSTPLVSFASASRPSSQLKFGPVPENMKIASKDAIRNLARFLEIPIDTIQIGLGLGIYAIDLDAGKLSATPVQFHLILESGGKAVGSTLTTMMGDGSTGAAQGAGVTNPGQMANVLNELTGMAQLKSGEYEPRLVRLDAMRQVTWLKALGGGEDFIYTAPSGGGSYGLRNKTLYSVDEFLSIVLSPLRELRANPRNTRGGGSTASPINPTPAARATLLPATTAAADFESAAQSTNQTGLDLFHLVASTDPNANALISPYSIQSALAMTYAGADGVTRAEMARVLHYPADDATLAASFAELRSTLDAIAQKSVARAASRPQPRSGGPARRGGQPVQVDPQAGIIEWHMANRLYGQADYGFREPFLAAARNLYGAPIELLDFISASEPARVKINTWVEEQTRQKIRDLIPAGGVRNDTRIFLVNALYLKAPWQDVFRKQLTQARPFQVRGTTAIAVPTMRQAGSFGYAKRDGYTAITLPYLGRELQFLILLPDDSSGVEALAAKITPSVLRDSAKLEPSLIDLYLPKFQMAAPTLKLKDVFLALGMKTAFDQPAGSANFDRMAPRKSVDYLYLYEIFHKTFIALDEEGTEAAAATAVGGAGGGGPTAPPPEVHVDHPFLFAIQLRESGVCLFLGRVTDPR